MKTFLVSFLTIVLVQLGVAQTICGTDHFLEQQILENPSLQNTAEENWMVSDGPVSTSEGGRAVKIIPLVFHIFHDNGVGNITYEQILSAVDMVNEDFRRLNSDTSNTRALFKPYAADSEIEFRLAQIDPDGNCTNGIVRIDDPNASHNAGNNVKPLSYWPSNQYFNIWVVNDINSGGVQGTILGYAQFPGTGSWSSYGVVIRNDRIGRVGTATSGDRTFTHEIGHCLNLMHTFQSGCGSSCQSSGDRVCDTPPVDFSTQSCNYGQNQCSNDAMGNSPYTTNVVDQIENYMSYNDCQNMFSFGQKTRMQNALDNFTQLSQLTSSTNLTATGVLNTNPGICKAEFEVESQIVCVGQDVTFTDLSFYNPKSHQWNFEGADVASSTDQNPMVSYSKPGTYEVSLTVFDSNAVSVTSVKTNYITVLSSLGKTAPFTENFDNKSTLEELEWFPTLYPNGFGWYLSSDGSFSGNQSIKANGFGQDGKVDINSSTFDASNLKSGTLSFRHAYAPRPGETSNYIRIYVSGTCGETWNVLKVIGGNDLATRNELNGPYNFPNTADWKLTVLTIPSQYLTANLRIKIEYNVNGGNNLFMDDINLTGSLNRNLELRFPYNGVGGISANPTLNWNAIDTVDYYLLEVDTDTSFSSANYWSEQLTYISSSSNNTDTEWLAENLMDGQTYYWKVTGYLNGMDTAISETWSFKVDSSALGINTVKNSGFKVTAYPNPANETVFLNVKSDASMEITINLYTISGNLVKTVYSGYLAEKQTQFTLARNNLSSGVYFIHIVSENGTETQRIIFE